MSGNAKHDWPSKIRNYEIGDELGHGAFSHVCKDSQIFRHYKTPASKETSFYVNKVKQADG